MSLNTQWDTPRDPTSSPTAGQGNPVVLMVLDHLNGRPELRHTFQRNGYYVIDTDNGQDAARHARVTRPDVLVVDLDVPLLYGLVAARLIIKHAQVGPVPAVIVTHEDIVDTAPLIEVGVNRDEYVTRFSDYQELQRLLDFLLPIVPTTADGPPHLSVLK